VSNLPDGLRLPRADPLTSRLPLMALADDEHLTNAGIGVLAAQIATAQKVTISFTPGRTSASTSALPTPTARQLGRPADRRADLFPTLAIIGAAGLLAVSVLLATTRPRRLRRPTTSR
jgi:hypothetical protein